jgi:hypothetical protein
LTIIVRTQAAWAYRHSIPRFREKLASTAPTDAEIENRGHCHNSGHHCQPIFEQGFTICGAGPAVCGSHVFTMAPGVSPPGTLPRMLKNDFSVTNGHFRASDYNKGGVDARERTGARLAALRDMLRPRCISEYFQMGEDVCQQMR